MVVLIRFYHIFKCPIIELHMPQEGACGAFLSFIWSSTQRKPRPYFKSPSNVIGFGDQTPRTTHYKEIERGQAAK